MMRLNWALPYFHTTKLINRKYANTFFSLRNFVGLSRDQKYLVKLSYIIINQMKHERNVLAQNEDTFYVKNYCPGAIFLSAIVQGDLSGGKLNWGRIIQGAIVRGAIIQRQLPQNPQGSILSSCYLTYFYAISFCFSMTFLQQTMQTTTLHIVLV